MRYLGLLAGIGLIVAGAVPAQALTVNGASADLDMRATLTGSNGLVLTFVPGHGMNGAYAYVYTDVGGVVKTAEQKLGVWPNDTASWSASALTPNGAAHGSVTVNTAGFDYSIHADGMVQGLGLGDYGLAMGDAYAWPDWLRTDHAGTATLTIDYTYTLDTRDTCDYGEAYVYMNAFFADHARVNRLTAKDEWTLGYGSNPNTTIVEYGDSIGAGDYVMVSHSVSWNVVIPDMSEPNTWWSIWAYGEAGVEVEPVPEPVTMAGVMLGIGSIAGYVRRRRPA